MLDPDLLRTAALAGSLGTQLIFAIGLCGGLGHYADGKWGTAPWLLISGCVLGLLAGTVLVFRGIKPLLANAQPPDQR